MRKVFFIITVAVCAYSADSSGTVITTTPPVSTDNPQVIANKTEDKGLKKQQKIKQPSTTWSKIKDLFM